MGSIVANQLWKANISFSIIAMMERLRQAADQTKVTVKMPAKLVGMYGDFITKNAGAVGQVEGALRSLTYIIPGRFRESELASESLNSGVQLLALYHDSLLSRALAQSLQQRKHHQTPHNRYTGFYCEKSATYKGTAVTLQVIQYTELLLEMMAKRKGEKSRWRMVVVLETIKAMCRLILMRLTNSRPLLNPPLPEREVIEERTEEDILPSPPSERSQHSEAGSEQWTMSRTSLTLPPLPSSEDISSYLLSKVLTADDIKPPDLRTRRNRRDPLPRAARDLRGRHGLLDPTTTTTTNPPQPQRQNRLATLAPGPLNRIRRAPTRQTRPADPAPGGSTGPLATRTRRDEEARVGAGVVGDAGRLLRERHARRDPGVCGSAEEEILVGYGGEYHRGLRVSVGSVLFPYCYFVINRWGWGAWGPDAGW